MKAKTEFKTEAKLENKIGWCGPIANAPQMRAAGLDYIEAQLVPMKLEDDSAFAAAKTP